jgi:hypothetical protein
MRPRKSHVNDLTDALTAKQKEALARGLHNRGYISPFYMQKRLSEAELQRPPFPAD